MCQPRYRAKYIYTHTVYNTLYPHHHCFSDEPHPAVALVLGCCMHLIHLRATRGGTDKEHASFLISHFSHNQLLQRDHWTFLVLREWQQVKTALARWLKTEFIYTQVYCSRCFAVYIWTVTQWRRTTVAKMYFWSFSWRNISRSVSRRASTSTNKQKHTE